MFYGSRGWKRPLEMLLVGKG